MRKCNACEIEKEYTDFEGNRNTCKKCRCIQRSEYLKQYKAKNKESLKAKDKEYREKNKAKIRERKQEYIKNPCPSTLHVLKF